ncbi:hypothetical protein GOP47_0022490, partial [Adiantum capillus-veneris]
LEDNINVESGSEDCGTSWKHMDSAYLLLNGQTWKTDIETGLFQDVRPTGENHPLQQMKRPGFDLSILLFFSRFTREEASMANSISIVSLFLLICHLLSTSSASPTAPAFIWSNHRFAGLHTQEAVDYHVLTPKALVNTLMQKLEWSSLLCNSDSGESEKLDTVVAFVGNEFYSEDVAHDARVDSSPVLRILKEHFMSSRYSLAFPYVSVTTGGGGILNILVSSIKDSCNLKSRPGKTLIVGSCVKGTFDPNSPILTEGIELVDTVEDVEDFISRRKTSRKSSETDVILTCPVSKHGLEEGESEVELLVSVLSALRQSGTRNAVFYASDPMSGHEYNGRMLASNTTSTNTTCDDICETIAGVYEGIIVAVTLLIILISGLCCMMGIDTPSRFESSQE